MSKKSILIGSFIGSLLLSSQFLFGSHACYVNKLCNRVNDFINQDNLTIILIMPFVFFFSLITYKMRDEVFQAWWKFARWFVPVIILVTFLVNSKSRGGGVVATMSSGFDLLIIGLFYAVFVITSLVKITLAYRRTR